MVSVAPVLLHQSAAEVLDDDLTLRQLGEQPVEGLLPTHRRILLTHTPLIMRGAGATR